MKTVADVIGVSRSNLIERLKERPRQKRIGRPPLPDDEFVAAIKAVIAEIRPMGTGASTPFSNAKPWRPA